MTTFIDRDTGFPCEVPCAGCGWPQYCCLCQDDDDEVTAAAPWPDGVEREARYLLRHIAGDLYAVLAQWDLTELERAVMAERIPA